MVESELWMKFRRGLYENWLTNVIYIEVVCGIILKNNYFLFKSKLQKSSFMFVSDCKVYPLSSIITENILYVCKSLNGSSFALNSVYFYG
ncbi:hypothetical protein Hanom_Chr17g01559321 [Helianthus anomalus]